MQCIPQSGSAILHGTIVMFLVAILLNFIEIVLAIYHWINVFFILLQILRSESFASCRIVMCNFLAHLLLNLCMSGRHT